MPTPNEAQYAKLRHRPLLPEPPVDSTPYTRHLDRALADMWSDLSQRLQASVEAAELGTITAGTTTLTVTFGNPQPDDQYLVFAIPNWAAYLWLSAAATTGFTLTASAAPVADGTVRWMVVR